MRTATVRRTDAAASLVDFLTGYGNDQEAAFLEIIGHISDRGDLNGFCAARGIRIGMLIAWIRRDADRSRRYELALSDRRALDAEAVRGKWVEVMDQKPEVAPKWSDVIKASELMGKYSGILHDGPVELSRDQSSEDELREQLRELLSRNPDVSALVMRGSTSGDVVDAVLVSEVVSGITGERVAPVFPTVPTPPPEPVVAKPRREESEQAKAARQLRKPKPPKQPNMVDKIIVVHEVESGLL